MGMIRRARRQARDPASGSFGHRPVGAALSLTSGCSASNRSRATRKAAIHPSGTRSATSWRTVRSSALPYRGASYRRSKQAIETGDLHHGRGVHDAPLDRRPLLEDVVERGSGAQIAGHAASSQARQGAVIRGADALIISAHGASGGPSICWYRWVYELSSRLPRQLNAVAESRRRARRDLGQGQNVAVGVRESVARVRLTPSRSRTRDRPAPSSPRTRGGPASRPGRPTAFRRRRRRRRQPHRRGSGPADP